MNLNNFTFLILSFGSLLLLLSSQIVNAQDIVFQSETAEVSFRYPNGWTENESQLSGSEVLLYASDGSEATCALNAGFFEELRNLSEQQIDAYRHSNHSHQYFETILKNQFLDLVIIRYWRGYLGQKYAGFVEYSNSLYVDDRKISATSYMGATFANGRRYVLTCNAPTGKEASAKEAFDHIRNTMLFMH